MIDNVGTKNVLKLKFFHVIKEKVEYLQQFKINMNDQQYMCGAHPASEHLLTRITSEVMI